MRQMLTRLPLKTIRRPLPPPPETVRADPGQSLDRLESEFFARTPA